MENVHILIFSIIWQCYGWWSSKGIMIRLDKDLYCGRPISCILQSFRPYEILLNFKFIKFWPYLLKMLDLKTGNIIPRYEYICAA